MQDILEWGYELIIWLQQFSPTLDPFFQMVTALGAEDVFLLLLPLVFWCLDKRRGASLSLFLFASAYINYSFKALFDQPRPSPDRVSVLAQEASPGLPSGHSQNSIIVYGYLAAYARRPWAWVAAALIAFLVGLSRVYLGVHFPSDVLAGWSLGVALLVLYLPLESRAERRPISQFWPHKLVLAILLPLALFLVYANEDSAQLMGAFAGTLVGLLVERRWVNFSTQGSKSQKALRFLAGIIVVVAIWAGAKAIFPDQPTGIALAFRFVRYGLLGIWASLGAPWLFVRLGLAPLESPFRDGMD